MFLLSVADTRVAASLVQAPPYRARVVRDPRGVLLEFGTRVSDDVEVRVWDSNTELRYLVLPQRPAGTDGWTEEQLAELVSATP